VSKLYATTGVITLVSFISPYRADRDAVRNKMESGDFIEVYMKIPLSVCEDRDPKGLYKAARAGKIKGANFPRPLGATVASSIRQGTVCPLCEPLRLTRWSVSPVGRLADRLQSEDCYLGAGLPATGPRPCMYGPISHCVADHTVGALCWRAGEGTGFTGIDDPYEEPQAAELVIEVSKEDGVLMAPEKMAAQLMDYLKSKGYLGA
jgi:hypothetical protein